MNRGKNLPAGQGRGQGKLKKGKPGEKENQERRKKPGEKEKPGEQCVGYRTCTHPAVFGFFRSDSIGFLSLFQSDCSAARNEKLQLPESLWFWKEILISGIKRQRLHPGGGSKDAAWKLPAAPREFCQCLGTFWEQRGEMTPWRRSGRGNLWDSGTEGSLDPSFLAGGLCGAVPSSASSGWAGKRE